MSVLFVTDPLDSLQADIDSSIGLMAAAQDVGESVWICQPEDLCVVAERVGARVRRIRLRPRSRGCDHRWLVDATWFDVVETRFVDVVESMSLVLVRIDPPVDSRYLHTTYLLDLVAAAGVKVTNSAAGIRMAHEKIFALHYPELCPPTLVSANLDQIHQFLDEHGLAVIKPVDGFAGTDVWLLRSTDVSATALIESATRRGTRHVIVQRYLPAVESGNKRLFLLGGEIIGSVGRLPSTDDFRIGPPNFATSPDDRDRLIARTLSPVLREQGLDMAGLDVIDGYLIEVNLTCPGGLHKADALLGTNLCETTMRHLLSQPSERLQSCPT